MMMIPKKIHYCWFGRNEMPELVRNCIASWHQQMPDYEYKLWNEDNFDVDSVFYTKEAYGAHKFAFVSDYVRLWALKSEGGIYLDTDVMALKPFDALLVYNAFAGFEGSKHLPMGTCVMASTACSEWITETFESYKNRHFIVNGKPNLTTNVQFITANMRDNGFIQNGQEQDYKDLHVFPVEYFSPRHTTGEYILTENTYSDHLGLGSWAGQSQGWKSKIGKLVGSKNMTRLIKLKRAMLG